MFDASKKRWFQMSKLSEKNVKEIFTLVLRNAPLLGLPLLVPLSQMQFECCRMEDWGCHFEIAEVDHV